MTPLPSVMCKRLVGLCHTMGIFLLFDRSASVVGGIQDFGRELLLHGLFAAASSVGDNPADRQRGSPVRSNFDWNLISGPAYAPGLHFQHRLDCVEPLLKELHRVLFGPVLDQAQRTVENVFGHTLLSPHHHAIHELRRQRAAVNRIGQGLALRYISTPRHFWQSPATFIILNGGESTASPRTNPLGTGNCQPNRFAGAFPGYPGAVNLKEWLAFWSLGPIFRAGVLAILNSNGVQSTPHHMVANAREVLDTSTADQHDGVFLQVVPDSGDVGCYLNPVGKTDTRNFTQSGVRFLGCRRVHPRAHPSALRTSLQSRTLRLKTNLLSARSNQLIEGRQTRFSLTF